MGNRKNEPHIIIRLSEWERLKEKAEDRRLERNVANAQVDGVRQYLGIGGGDSIRGAIDALKADAALGALLKLLPDDWQITRGHSDGEWVVIAGADIDDEVKAVADTPEEALRAAIGEGEEKI